MSGSSSGRQMLILKIDTHGNSDDKFICRCPASYDRMHRQILYIIGKSSNAAIQVPDLCTKRATTICRCNHSFPRPSPIAQFCREGRSNSLGGVVMHASVHTLSQQQLERHCYDSDLRIVHMVARPGCSYVRNGRTRGVVRVAFHTSTRHQYP